MSTLRPFALLCALSFCACGSNTKTTEGPDSTQGDPQETSAPEESPEMKFERQRTDAVEKMCERLIDCAVEDAKATQPPEEAQELVEVAPQARKDCESTYAKANLSPRQVMGVRTCLEQPIECAEFGECLVSASKGDEN